MLYMSRPPQSRASPLISQAFRAAESFNASSRSAGTAASCLLQAYSTAMLTDGQAAQALLT